MPLFFPRLRRRAGLSIKSGKLSRLFPGNMELVKIMDLRHVFPCTSYYVRSTATTADYHCIDLEAGEGGMEGVGGVAPLV